MKILVLNGSPKKKSDTFRLTEAFLRGMNRGETHEVHLIHVREKQIRSRPAGAALAAGSGETGTASSRTTRTRFWTCIVKRM